MTSPESDPQTELLRSIAASLKGIQSSLDQLSGAVEGVSEAIEKAHEPEGDLGHHLVGALKDISSALHKKAHQERSPQPHQAAQRPYPPQQQRREERQPRNDYQPKHQQEEASSQDQHKHVEGRSSEFPVDTETETPPVPTEPLRPRKPRPNRRRGGANRGPHQTPIPSQDSASSASE